MIRSKSGQMHLSANTANRGAAYRRLGRIAARFFDGVGTAQFQRHKMVQLADLIWSRVAFGTLDSVPVIGDGLRSN
jgi:hypothetical protein